VGTYNNSLAMLCDLVGDMVSPSTRFALHRVRPLLQHHVHVLACFLLFIASSFASRCFLSRTWLSLAVERTALAAWECPWL
jgi:hypothetical protein